MQRPDTIDYAKLLGFDSVSHQILGSVDFQDDTVGAKLGAKVGTEAQESAKVTEGVIAKEATG